MSHVVVADEELHVMHVLLGDALCLRPVVSEVNGWPVVRACRRKRGHRRPKRCSDLDGQPTMRTSCGMTDYARTLVPWDGEADPLPLCPRCAGVPEPVEEPMFG